MLSDEELKGKIITGVLIDLDKTEYTERAEKVRDFLEKNKPGI